jgi:succinate dehydrogenase flavin-adding protein (antitoxin of CptAB toxin-antitoxin module)
MDLLLQRFVEQRFDDLSDAEKQVFSELLDQADPDIMDWIMGRSTPPTAAMQSMVDMIREAGKPETRSS